MFKVGESGQQFVLVGEQREVDRDPIMEPVEDAECRRVDKRRNTEAALKLFDGVASKTVLVCDAFSAYKNLRAFSVTM